MRHCCIRVTLCVNSSVVLRVHHSFVLLSLQQRQCVVLVQEIIHSHLSVVVAAQKLQRLTRLLAHQQPVDQQTFLTL